MNKETKQINNGCRRSQADSGGGAANKQDGEESKKILQRLAWEKREGMK